MALETVKGHLFIAIRKKRNDERFSHVVRIGYSKRDMSHWVRLYRREGFRKIHVKCIKVINHTGSKLTLEKARELLLYNIAQRLKDANVQIENFGNCEYAYFIKSKKPILSLLEELKEGFTIIDNSAVPDIIEQEPVEVKSSRCLVM